MKKDEKDEKDIKNPKDIKDIKDIPGIGEATIKKLYNSGIVTLIQVANSNPKRLQEIDGIGDETAFNLIENAREALGLNNFLSGVEIERDEEKINRITTSSKELNELLTPPKLRGKIIGGIESMLITEFYGMFGTAKSQLGFQLAINVQLPKEKGGLEGSAIVLDSEGTFKSSRIKQMCEARGYNADKILQNIYCAKVISTDHLNKLLVKAEQYIREKNVKLIVVDSIAALLRKEFHGRDQLPDRQATLNETLTILQNLADVYNIPIYVTNQVMSRPDAMFFMDPTIPVGGNIMGHATCRVYLRKAKDNKRIAQLVDSSSLPMGEAVFRITEAGIEDVEENE